MGNRLAKPPPLDRPIAPPPRSGRGRNAQMPRPFPILTPQSYLPGAGGGGGIYPNYPPMGGSSFPVLSPNSYLPPTGTLEPPIMNYSGGSGMMPQSFPPIYAPSIPPTVAFPPPMPYPNQGMTIGQPPPFYEPGLPTYPHRRPMRISRRSRRSRRCRPVIHIVESSSCSSLSSYTTISSCSRSRRHHRSHSHSRRRERAPQQQQQPIILLPMQCQQPAPAIANPIQNQIQQQPQQIILPPIQVQQPGQFQQQPFALSQLPFQQQQQLALPPIQQQQLALPPIQLNSSNFIPSTNSSPLMIPSGQPMIQPSASMPQIANFGQGQQMQSGGVRYIQATQQSSSPLQYISAEPRSTIAPQRVLVNSTNKKQSITNKSVRRSNSTRELPQSDLKFGRRPFDWYNGEKKNKIINENVRAGHRGSTAVG